MLSVQELHVYYGAIHAVKGVSIQVGQGEMVALLGANGAGKTTTLKALAGVLKPRSGRVSFQGQEIAGAQSHRVTRAGICLVPEGRHVFPRMSVHENLLMGAYILTDERAIEVNLDRVYSLFPVLKERRAQMAGTLSGGEQQMLAIGRALMVRPQLLMLDEPSLGLAPVLVSRLFRLIQEINGAGTTVLLVEQNANMALAIAHRAYVLETGRVLLSGTCAELRNSATVREAYLS